LTVTWQSALKSLKTGGTAFINQTPLNRELSLAFKRIKDHEKEEPSRAFRLLIDEISVLGHRSVQGHPNVIELLGIGWDIPSDEAVWPVLVFEKSQYGDMEKFANLLVGQHLKMHDRLDICIGIGTALADLHYNSMWPDQCFASRTLADK